MSSELLVRVCRLAKSSNSYWGIMSSGRVSLLPETAKLKMLHGKSWSEIKAQAQEVVDTTSLRFLPLFDEKPDKVLCVGLNYKDHCDEQNMPQEKRPKQPLIFDKFASTIITNGSKIKRCAAVDSLDYEVELACIIGEGGKHIREDDAMSHVFGFSVANDITSRDWQKKKNGGQWLLGKSQDTFCPLGPGILHRSLVKDAHDMNIRAHVNGELRQNSNTKNLIFRIPRLISHISSVVTLLPGDIILTGTPGGVGAFFDPPKFLQPGDVVKCTIDGIGVLENEVIQE